ncbi:DNA-binding protein inhibitor ID-2-like isoform X2 [Engraulis encrasicolus]|uniref:DNA-binding protein inhibitor ID-2-like isoform X2 n=1 Tax=Engraulis encrasicolus TaxID=184585 RepID=UPI002FCFC4D6
MKAASPVTSLRRNTTSRFSDLNAAISRNNKSTAVDDALSLLYNMNDCYSKLKELVPSLPQNQSVSKMEILQHVIDYILDLQLTLDSSSSAPPQKPQPQQPQQHPQRREAPTPRTPLASINNESNELSTEVGTDDSRALFR